MKLGPELESDALAHSATTCSASKQYQPCFQLTVEIISQSSTINTNSWIDVIQNRIYGNLLSRLSERTLNV